MQTISHRHPAPGLAGHANRSHHRHGARFGRNRTAADDRHGGPFIVDVPQGFSDPATVLPVQIYLWADSPERAFVERTSAAIMVLLCLLLAMNAAAVLLRNKFERQIGNAIRMFSSAERNNQSVL